MCTGVQKSRVLESTHKERKLVFVEKLRSCDGGHRSINDLKICRILKEKIKFKTGRTGEKNYVNSIELLLGLLISIAIFIATMSMGI